MIKKKGVRWGRIIYLISLKDRYPILHFMVLASTLKIVFKEFLCYLLLSRTLQGALGSKLKSLGLDFSFALLTPKGQKREK